MFSRRRLLITATALCHLLALPPLVTSQLPQSQVVAAPLSSATSPQAAQSEDPFARPRRGEEVLIQAEVQEKQGPVYRLRGDVEISFRTFVLRAGEVTYNEQTGDVTASDHVTLDGGPNDEHLEASRAQFNLHSGTGKFYDVIGTTGAKLEGRNVVLTSSAPFAFMGKMVERVSETRYVVHDGAVTSCALPDPIWTFNAERITVDVGDTARTYHTTFRLKKIPLLYLPYAQHPVNNLGRKSGLLVPVIGQSSRKGLTLGESYYWAISRSMDATIGAEYYSRRGWAQIGQFRSRPSERSFVNVNYFGVVDRGIGSPPVDQGGQDVRLNAEAPVPGGFRGVANINYLSSFVFRLAFEEQFSQAVNSEVKSAAFLSRTYRGLSMNSLASRYQNFQSTERGDLINILHVPTFEASTVDYRLLQSPMHWGFDAALEGLSRREPAFKTDDLVARVDLRPRAAVPLLFRGWSFRPEVALRNTYYTQRRLPDGAIGVPVSDPVNRRAVEASVELRPPSFARIFQANQAGRAVKHSLEPQFTYRYVTGVNNFANIVRFDARDILSDTNEVEYGLVQRLYLKRPDPNCPPVGAAPEQKDAATRSASCRPAAREVLRWELAQKYFFDRDFGGALVSGRRNVLTTTAEFAGIAFLTEPRRFSPVISRLRVLTGANTDVQWNLDFDPRTNRIHSSTAFINYRLGEFFAAGSHAFLRAPGEIFTSTAIPSPETFNQVRLLLGYGHPNKRGLSTAANIGFDAHLTFLQYGALQSMYNWHCCGISVEFRRLALGAVRNENQVRFAFTLADVGTFGNLRRQERLF
jgi:LPS-assembly protein